MTQAKLFHNYWLLSVQNHIYINFTSNVMTQFWHISFGFNFNIQHLLWEYDSFDIFLQVVVNLDLTIFIVKFSCQRRKHHEVLCFSKFLEISRSFDGHLWRHKKESFSREELVEEVKLWKRKKLIRRRSEAKCYMYLCWISLFYLLE